MDERLYELFPTYLLDDIKSIGDYCRKQKTCDTCLLLDKMLERCALDISIPQYWVDTLEEDFI